MKTFTTKKRERRSRADTDGPAQGGDATRTTPRLVDNRPAAVTQRSLDESLNRSDKVQSQLQLQQSLNESPRVAAQMKLAATLSGRNSGPQTQQPVQRQEAIEEEGMIQRQANQRKRAGNGSNEQSPIQMMTFKRFQGMSRLVNWFYSDTETKLLATEKRIEDLLIALQPYKETEYGEQLESIEDQFDEIKTGTYDQDDYSDTLEKIKNLFAELNTISTRIAVEEMNVYGEKNEDLLNLRLKQNLKPRTAKLLAIITRTIYKMPDVMKTAENTEIIKKALYPNFERNGFDEGMIGEHTLSFAQSRSDQLLKNFQTLIIRVLTDWDKITKKFGITGDLKYIHLTGSDFHKGGQQVAIIESTDGGEVVYKPRSVSPDEGLIGEGGVFEQLNLISDKTVELPSMKFMEKQDYAKKSYAYVEFQEHKKEMSEEGLEQYYRRYGQMVIASKLLGVNDLHHENIMAVAGTPTIIDAETSFLPYVMSAVSYAKTEIDAALGTFQVGDKLTNTAFVTPEEQEHWDTMDEEERQKYRGIYAYYVTEVRRNDLSGKGNYLGFFTLGLKDMLTLIAEKKKEIIEMMMNKIKTLHHIRVVPFGTIVFSGSLRSFRNSMDEGNDAEANDVVLDDIKRLKEALKEKGFSLLTDAWVSSIYGSGVGAGLKKDYEMGDTPIFHFEPYRNELIYHDQVVAMHKEWFNPEELITRTVNSVGSSNISTILENLGIK
jgi:hypothetical protein